MEYIFPEQIYNDLNGINNLLDFYWKFNKVKNEKIILNFEGTTWLESSYLAIVGAIREELLIENEVIIKVNSKLYDLLKRNGFVDYCQEGKTFENFIAKLFNQKKETIIRFAKFDTDEKNAFNLYLETNLLCLILFIMR
ncbi:MAG TPA: hypothetical protein DDW90_05000 [Cyanobacteria bacterium UBA9971]|nr:hypothetical protein [Cyanobacteria bacterium UBA9971]